MFGALLADRYLLLIAALVITDFRRAHSAATTISPVLTRTPKRFDADAFEPFARGYSRN